MRKFCSLLAVLCLFVSAATAETATVLILHTNDLHDHIRAGYEGVGGMPYVSGYIKDVQSHRKDVLVLDAGDVTEKGDMLAFETHSEIMYEAMGKIGYAATVPGNHDLHYDLQRLRAWESLASGMSMLCVNYVDAEGKPCFKPSKLFEVNGIKIGVIGVTVPKNDEDSLSYKACAEQLRQEADRLVPETHMLISLCHLSSKACAEIATQVPSVKVFISGHSHELLKEPVIAKPTGAIIVQAGHYARYVGRLELTIDLGERKIVDAHGNVVEMRHDRIPCDKEMAEWIAKREQEVCPQASRIVARAEKELRPDEAAILAAAALRWKAGADIALCNPSSIIRSGLPAGDIDVNALFLTGGQRGVTVVDVKLPGQAICDYVKDLKKKPKGGTEWSGFRGGVEYDKDQGQWIAHTDLEPGREYRVVLPETEWKTRFQRAAKKDAAATTCPFTFIEALAAYAEYLSKEKITLDAQVQQLRAMRSLQPQAAGSAASSR